MSDFLSNLVTRALGLETNVRPLLPSRFGPPTESAFGPAPLLSDVEQEDTENMVFSSMQSSRHRRRMAADRENPLSESPRTISTSNRSAISTATSRQSEETASLTPNRSTESRAPAVAPLVVPVGIRPVSARDDLSTPTPVARADSLSVPAPPERLVRESVREVSRTEVSVPTQKPRVKRVAAPQEAPAPAHLTPRPPAPSPFAPMIKPAAPTAPPFDEKRGEAPPQPTIQVTIGRIEVRATPAPTRKPANNAATSTGALSLDDYLSQRAGGRR